MKLIGTISGKVEPSEFDIMLSSMDIERGAFIKINHESYGWVLARIENLSRYMKDEQEILTANAIAVGYRDGKQVLMPRSPFKPDARVYSADRDLIRDVIGLNKNRRDSIYLGLLEGHDIPVYLDIHKAIGKHISILAKTGAGKSYTVGVTLEELLKNKIPVVVVDPHGEYSTLKQENDDYDQMLTYNIRPRSYENQIIEYAANTLVNPGAEKLTLKPRFSLKELIDIMPLRLNENQKSILYTAFKRFRDRDYTIQQLIDAVQMEDGKPKWKVINGLEELRNSGLFEGTPLLEKDIVKDGQLTIMNLKGASPEIQELIVAEVARFLFEAIKVGRIPPFLFIIEEAHNFCPERGFGVATSSHILRTIASEGRKFGLYLCVVSQRPAKVDKNIISQSNTQIILKVTNPNDLNAIGRSIEGFTQGMESDIRELSVGQALVVGECVEQPIVVNVRVRETKHAGARTTEEKEKIEERKPSTLDKIKPIFIEEKVKETTEKPVETKPRLKKKKSIRGRLKSVFIREREEAESK